MEITLPNSQGNQSFRSVAGKRSSGRAVYLGDLAWPCRAAHLSAPKVGARDALPSRRKFCVFWESAVFPGKGMREWTRDRRPGKWIVNEKLPPRKCRGAKQIVIPMIRQQYNGIWQDAERLRAFVDEWAQLAPELFPEDFDQAIACTASGVSRARLPGLKLRKIVLANGASYWLRPSFIFSYMTGTVDQLAYPLLLAANGVPFWLLTLGFGHSDMYWYRVIERLGRNSIMGTTVHDSAQFPSTWWRTSITPTGPARRATSRQPLAAAAVWASR